MEDTAISKCHTTRGTRAATEEIENNLDIIVEKISNIDSTSL